ITAMRLRFLSLSFLLVVSAVVVSCGRGKAMKTTGRVTLDDQPVEGALVKFIPVDPAKGMVASGVTGSDGTFRLTTTNPNDGRLPGEYVVVVTLDSPQGAPAGISAGPGGMRPGEMANMGKQAIAEQKKSGGKEPAKKATKIPQSYGDEKKTPFKNVVIPA